MKVLISDETTNDLSQWPAVEQDRLLAAFDAFSDGVPASSVRVASGPGNPIYAARLEDGWRVLFAPDRERDRIILLRVLRRPKVTA